MSKTDDTFDLASYAPVAERITRFYALHPHGRIVTRARRVTERMVLFEALVYRASADVAPAATGWASETPGDGDINTVACVENTETSAIGRALANLGITASRLRPSREEMAKAERVRGAGSRSGETAADPKASRPVAFAALVSKRIQPGPPRPLATAEDLAELGELLTDAERSGYPEPRSLEIRALIARGPRPGSGSLGPDTPSNNEAAAEMGPEPVPPEQLSAGEPILLSTVQRVQRQLRAWLDRHREG
jgi:hypothetical protein